MREVLRGVWLGVVVMLAYLVPLVVLLTPIDLLLGVGQKHDTAFGLATIIYTAGWVGGALAWLGAP